MYLTYEEYLIMGGNLDKTTFNTLEFKSEALVNYLTFNRLKSDTTVSTTVKKCIYELISLIYIKIQSLSLGVDSSNGSTNGAISSQSNDGYSTSFNVLSAQQAYDLVEKELTSTVKMMLCDEVNAKGQKLLYRGYYPNE